MSFVLVQRIESANGRPSTPFNDSADRPLVQALNNLGADMHLAFMGSAEFEWGRLTESGQRMLTAQRVAGLQIVSQTLARPTYKEAVHFICTPEQADEALPRWHQWASRPHPYTKGPLEYFRYQEWDHFGPIEPKAVAWWAISEDLIWARDAAVAQRILGAFATLASR